MTLYGVFATFLTVTMMVEYCKGGELGRLLIQHRKYRRTVIVIVKHIEQAIVNNQFFLVLNYGRKDDTSCDNHKSTYLTITKAKSICDLDLECGGFFHNCGGSTFILCGFPISERSSGCGSVLYRKGNFKIFHFYVSYTYYVNFILYLKDVYF